MSVDWLTNNLYWTNGALKKIMVSRHDGRYQLTLHHTSVQQPTGIAVDPINRFLFLAPVLVFCNIYSTGLFLAPVLVQCNINLRNFLIFS